jgi:Uma2 family endonuclease
MRISTQFTYEDLQHIPPDRNRYEIAEGDLLVTPAPDPLHQTLVLNLAAELRQHVRKNRLGRVFVAPCDIVFSSSTVLEPDVMFVSTARLHIIGKKNLSGPPDLVVEVLSESTAHVDREVKSKQYARYGVPELWLLDARGETIGIFRLGKGGYELVERLTFADTLTSPLFPGLRHAVSSLWES